MMLGSAVLKKLMNRLQPTKLDTLIQMNLSTKNIDATEETDIMQKDAPNNKATKSDSESEDNIDIMQKDAPKDKALKSDSDSGDNISLADLQGKDKKTTRDKPKRTVRFQNSTASPKKKKKKEISCKDCDKTFLTKNGVYKHQISHGGLKHFCTTCGKGFFWNCELEDHERRHTDK